MADYISDTTATYCDGSEWVAYEDEKCFKFVNKFTTRDNAEEICDQQRLKTDSYNPTLVSIKSESEQKYLTKYLFDLQNVKETVWIGAKRQQGNSSRFLWHDGSEINFSNWAEGNPIDETERECVEMRSKFGSIFSNVSELYEDNINGRWFNVPCDKNSLVICQKLQTWSFPQLQKTFLDARKELRDSLNNLRQNPVPIGFIYVQLPGQPEPKTLW